MSRLTSIRLSFALLAVSLLMSVAHASSVQELADVDADVAPCIPYSGSDSDQSNSAAGTPCSQGTTCCGNMTASAACIPSGDMCCPVSPTAFGCLKSQSCCGTTFGNNTGLCCASADTCCGRSSGNATCCPPGGSCCGSHGATPMCCTSSEICTLDGKCVSSTPMPPLPPGPVRPGEVVWEIMTSFPIATPAVYSATSPASVIFGSDNVYAVDPATGARQWMLNTTTGVSAGPFIAGNFVAFTTAQHITVASSTTGAVAWSNAFEASAAPIIAVVGQSLLVTDQSLTLSAYALATGKKQWRRPDVQYPPAAIGTTIFMQGSEKLRAVDSSSGEVMWTTENPSPCSAPLTFQTGGSVVVGCTGYVGVSGGVALVGFDPKTGNNLWTLNFAAGTLGQVELTQTTLLIVNTSDSSVTSIDPRTGATRWSSQFTAAPTIIGVSPSGDRVVVSLFIGSDSDSGSQSFNQGYQITSVQGATGKALWNVTGSNATTSASVLDKSGDVIFAIAAPYQGVVALSGATGALMWHVRTGDAVVAAPLVPPGLGYAYVGSTDYRMYGILVKD